VTSRTEKIIPLNTASHKVIGGIKQNRTRQPQSPGKPAEDEKGETAHAAKIADGPKMYTPARTQPNFGIFFRIIQVIEMQRAKPITEAKFRAIVLSVHL
jgi:hypothetical protein